MILPVTGRDLDTIVVYSSEAPLVLVQTMGTVATVVVVGVDKETGKTVESLYDGWEQRQKEQYLLVVIVDNSRCQ